MDSIAGVVILIIVIIVSNIAKSQKKNQRNNASRPGAARPNTASSLRKPAAPAPGKGPGAPMRPSAAAQARPAASARPAVQASTSPAAPAGRNAQGSIAMPPREKHEHEGKEMPCPADERDRKAAVRPIERAAAEEKREPAQQGPSTVLPEWSSQSVVQGVVMAEVLNNPAFRRPRGRLRAS